MNTIYLEDSVYTTITEHPEVKDLLVEIGFKPLNQPQMVHTVGRITNLVKGSKIDKMLGYTNLDDEKGFAFFQKFLRDQGIIDRLEELGIEEGDLVNLGDLSFDYYK